MEGSWLRRNKGNALALAFILGTLPFINLWDFPTIAVMAVVLLFVRAYGQTGGRLLQAAGRALGVALPLLLGALLLFLPFYLTFHSQAMGILPFREEATRPFHSLLIWGLFLFLSVTFLLFQLRETPARDLWRRHTLIAAGVALVPFGLWVLVEIVVVPVGRWVIEAGNLGPVEGALVPVFAGTLSEAMGNIARRFLDILPLMVLMGTAMYGLLGRARVQGRCTNHLRPGTAGPGLPAHPGAGAFLSGGCLWQPDEHRVQAVLPGVDIPCCGLQLRPITMSRGGGP